MKRTPGSRKNSRGVALFTALALLALFVLLGAVYMQYMTLEYDGAKLSTWDLHARTAARAGVSAAAGELVATLNAGDAQAPGGPKVYEFPLYKAAGGTELDSATGRFCRTTVSVVDECAKLNVNHAPVNALRLALDIPPDLARAIRQSMPAEGAAPSAQHRWMVSLDELVTRPGLLGADDFAKLDKSLLTVQSVADPAEPGAHVNVNTAPAKVLEAVLDISPETAQHLVAARQERPFQSVEELASAAGKTPDFFNVRPPQELAFESNCYRIVCDAEVVSTMEGAPERVLDRAHLEAVIYLGGSGPVIKYLPDRGEEAEPAAEPAPVEETAV